MLYLKPGSGINIRIYFTRHETKTDARLFIIFGASLVVFGVFHLRRRIFSMKKNDQIQ